VYFCERTRLAGGDVLLAGLILYVDGGLTSGRVTTRTPS
jgi:hypothetical protein